jgi:tRNA/tmRNA/rRNA uracil-C5-methylase (TrmA/RlmC/RlmD family)
MISRCIAPHARKTLGVDISPASVDKFNQWAKDHNYAPDEMQAIVAELKGKSGELDDQRFDIAIVSPVYCREGV